VREKQDRIDGSLEVVIRIRPILLPQVGTVRADSPKELGIVQMIVVVVFIIRQVLWTQEFSQSANVGVWMGQLLSTTPIPA
jgi:hypothetical protein